MKKKLNNLKLVSLLEKTVTFDMPKNWQIKQKDDTLFVITFPFGKYPSLDINIEFLDKPKLNSEKEIQKLLLEGTPDNYETIKKDKDTSFIKYKVQTKEENLKLWKVLNFNRPRGFRIIRLSLGWVKNEDADKIVKLIVEEIEKILSRIIFLKGRNKYDNLAQLENKLENLQLTEQTFWNNFRLSLPARWKKNFDKQKQTISVEIDNTNKYQLFFEIMNVKTNKKNYNERNNDQLINKLIETMTNGIFYEKQSLRKTDNENYLFSFTVKELIKDNPGKKSTLINKMWYRIRVFEEKLMIVSFIFNYEDSFTDEGSKYSEKINKLISNSHII